MLTSVGFPALISFTPCSLGTSERGEACGATTGYAIRMDARRSTETRILFCTTGLLLRRMQVLHRTPHCTILTNTTQDNPTLADFSHVFVDEVHERSVDGDYCLALLQAFNPLSPHLLGALILTARRSPCGVMMFA